MNPSEICCVCERPATQHLGGRAYCDDDYARATRPNQGVLRSLVVVVVSLLAFSLILWAIGTRLGHPSREVLVILGLVLSLVPAALWLWFFYSQDRLEPEPRGYVLAVFFLAMLLTDFFALRGFALFELSKWLNASALALILGSILVKGFAFSLIVWAVVRFAVYPTGEFDERMDGIVYGTAAGLGVATMLNLNYVIESGGVLLAPGVANIVETALAQAAFGGMIGYFLGEAKFIDEPVWWMPVGVLLASVVNGLFLWQAIQVKASGTGVNVVGAIILAGVVAVVTFGVLIYLMRRATAETLASGSAR